MSPRGGKRLAFAWRSARATRVSCSCCSGRAARAVVAGLAGGVAIALLAGRGMQSLLFGVGVADPVSFAIGSALVCAPALAATFIPGLRALGRSPIEALREG